MHLCKGCIKCLVSALWGLYVSAEFMLVNAGATCVNNGTVTGGINAVMVDQNIGTVNMDVVRVNRDIALANIYMRYVSIRVVSVNIGTSQVNADIVPVLHGSVSVNTISTNAISSPFGVTLTPKNPTLTDAKTG